MKTNVPDNVRKLLDDIPEPLRPQGEEEVEFWRLLSWELAYMIKMASQVDNAQIVLNNCRRAGNQFIYEFFVNDRSLERTHALNFHGQNTSQWLYAGCIKVEAGRVTAHH